MSTALITGASSGFGVEFARLFAQDGHDVVLVARNKERLNRVSEEASKFGVKRIVLAKDLTQPNAPKEIFEALAAVNISVDILVNNAGFGDYGPFAETDIKRDLEMMHLNMDALVILTKLAIQQMKKKGSGKILNVASTAAFQPGPLMAVYYASKAFVLSFSDAVGVELKGTGITVTTLCPGASATEFQQSARAGNSQLFAGSNVMAASAVAEAGYKGLMKGQSVVIPGAANWMAAQSVRFLPRKTVTSVVKWIQRTRQ